MVSVIQSSAHQDKYRNILKPQDLCSDDRNGTENKIMACSPTRHLPCACGNGEPSIAEKTHLQKKSFIQTKSRRKNDMIRWTSVNELTLSFLKLGIYPKASNSVDEFLPPSIRIATKSQMKKCFTCRKRKKKLYSSRSSPLMCSNNEQFKQNFEDQPSCALDLDKTSSPQRLQHDNLGEPLSPAVKRYAKIIHSFRTKDETKAGIETEEIDDFLQGRIFVESPTKEYFLSMEVPSRSCNMSPISPYSPPYSDGNKDSNSRVANMSLVRKNIFEAKCELCHKSMLKKPELRCKKTKRRKLSYTINIEKLVSSPAVSITRLTRSDLKKWMSGYEIRNLRESISDHIVTKNCSVVLKRLDENDFKKHNAKMKTSKLLNSPAIVGKTFQMVTRSQKVFRV